VVSSHGENSRYVSSQCGATALVQSPLAHVSSLVQFFFTSCAKEDTIADGGYSAFLWYAECETMVMRLPSLLLSERDKEGCET